MYLVLLLFYLVFLAGTEFTKPAVIYKVPTQLNRSTDAVLQEQVEEHVISDLMTGPTHNFYNHLLVNVGLNLKCQSSACEKYSATGETLRELLNKRGENLDVTTGLTHNRVKLPVVTQLRNKNAGSSTRDVVITKLSQLTSVDQETLDIINAYDRKAYIVIVTADDNVYHDTESYILSKQMFNVYILRRGREEEMYIMYEVCAYCNAGVTQLRVYNSWRFQKGFTNQLRYEPSFKGQFFGATVKVGLTFTLMGYQIIQSANHKVTYRGSEYMLLDTISKPLNFQILAKQPKDGKACMDYEALKLVGFCAMLNNKEVDLAGFVYTINSESTLFFDPTAVYSILGRNIISANVPLKVTWSSIASSLDPAILIALLISYLLFVHAYWILGKYWYGHMNENYLEINFIFFSALWLEAVSLRRPGGLQMVTAGMWMLLCLFVTSLVFGEITSITASVAAAIKPVNSPEDMVKNELSWVSQSNYDEDYYLFNDERMNNLKKKRKLMSPTEALQYILDNPNEYVYYGNFATLEPVVRYYFLPNKTRNPFHVSPSLDVPYLITILVHKDAPFTEAITKKLLDVEASGLYRQKYVPDVYDMFGKEITTRAAFQEEFKSFNMRNMLIPMAFYFLGLFISVTAFFIENLKRINNKFAK